MARIVSVIEGPAPEPPQIIGFSEAWPEGFAGLLLGGFAAAFLSRGSSAWTIAGAVLGGGVMWVDGYNRLREA